MSHTGDREGTGACARPLERICGFNSPSSSAAIALVGDSRGFAAHRVAPSADDLQSGGCDQGLLTAVDDLDCK